MKQILLVGLIGLALIARPGAKAQENALQFDGVNDYVTFGAATATLGASNFTLECWFKKTGTNSYTSTGTGGLAAAVPLVAKGRGEADGDNRDCNYFLGITTNANGNALGADFEAMAGGANYPLVGRTRILNDVWYHAAATYDGTTWRLYLNGKLETNRTVNATPRYDSIQHASLGSALNSAGAAAGFFCGTLDEVRIWNYARTESEIRSTMYQTVTNAPGLLGRWGLNEGAGTVASNSVPTGPNGTLMNGPIWTNNTPFVLVPAGATWKYLDNGSDQGTAWREPDFDDSAWASGPAPLGYGDPWILTTVSYGPNPNNKYVTTYFRTTFVVTNPADFATLDLRVIRDDGIAVYLNGVGVYTNKLPATFDYLTYATTPEVGGAEETNWIGATLPVGPLVAGTNVIAAEVHQVNATSSDKTFVLELRGLPQQNAAPNVSITSPPANSTWPVGSTVTLTATASDPDGTISNVMFYAAGTLVGSDDTSPYNADWTPLAPGKFNLTAQAVDNLGATGTSAAVTVHAYEPGTGALQFDGASQYITFGPATATLGASNFTLEGWFRKLGPGTTASSGSGGVTAVPLITKGRGEAEGSTVDCNYFFGINAAGRLVADLERYGDGQNFPVTGNTVITNGAWYHLAVTYDGATWRLYVNGQLDTNLTVNALPRYDSIQHAAIGTAINSTGATEGRFEGNVDEVRIWNYARTAEQITANMSNAIVNAPGLLGRWSLDETGGTIASNSVAGSTHGTLVGSPIRCAGLNLESVNSPPVVMITAPTNGAQLRLGTNVTITATASDDGAVTSVEFFRDGDSLGVDTTPPYSVVWMADTVGNFVLTAVATDDTGLMSTSAPVNVTVFVPNDPPLLSLVRFPTNGASEVTLSPTIEMDVTDPEASDLTVALYGRLAGSATPGPDFTIVVLPDTQFYSESYPQIFLDQVNWIIANRTNLNIVYVGHVGDIVNQGDSQPYQWYNATNALYRLLDPVLTGTPDGIPLGVVPGNHDHVGGITLYNQFMGLSVFSNRSWYGGNMGSDNRNHYDLLTVSGLDFLFLYTDFNYNNLDYGPIDAWANSVLAAHPNRRAMILTHCILTTSATYDTSRSPNLYSTVGTNKNVFLMVCGHNHGEAYRIETNGNHIVHIALADYQSEPNGGNGWLRLYKFSPANNRINVETYSPTLNSNRTAASSRFTIPYQMSDGAGAPFFLVGTTNVPSGATASFHWPGLSPGTNYEWYVVISDGTNSIASATNRFSTVTNGSNPPPTVALTGPTDRQRFAAGNNVALAASASDANGFVARVEFLANGNKLGEDTTAPYEFTWNNIPAGDHQLRAVAYDSGGAFTTSAVVRISAVNPPGSTNTLIAAGSVWKYLDNGSDQGTAWRAPGFDDSTWASGPAPLGYGDPWIVTTVSYGTNASDKYITTYFRKTIIVTNAAGYASLNLRVQRDDGIAVYINGVGCYTNNLPATFDYRTWAPTIIDGANETNWVGTTLPASLLVEGTNVVCAEVHQRDGTSSDLTFNLELTGIIQGELDLTPPSVPTGLQALATATNAVRLSWAPSTDNEGGSGVAGYEIYRADTFIASNGPAVFTDTPVDPYTAHCYRVAAYDAAGNVSALSEPVCITPLLADADGNGLPDWWENAYFNQPIGADPNADSDGDSHNNLFEFVAGTDPTDANSRFAFRIEKGDAEAGQAVLIFAPRWPDRQYEVQWSGNLVEWTPLTNAYVVDDDLERRVQDLERTVGSRFYRIRIARPQ